MTRYNRMKTILSSLSSFTAKHESIYLFMVQTADDYVTVPSYWSSLRENSSSHGLLEISNSYFAPYNLPRYSLGVKGSVCQGEDGADWVVD